MDWRIAGAFLLALMSACSLVEILDIVEYEPQETPIFKMQKDTTYTPDTTRYPIVFDVVVENWEENEITIRP